MAQIRLVRSQGGGVPETLSYVRTFQVLKHSVFQDSQEWNQTIREGPG